jgi:E3 ubiquitin-protein ligase DOA10
MLRNLSVHVVKNGYELVVEKEVEKVEGEEKYIDYVEEKFVFEKAAKLKKAIKLFLDEVN